MIVAERPDLLEDVAFERIAVLGGSRRQPPPSLQMTGKPDVEQVVLRRGDRLAFPALGQCRHFVGEKRVLQDLVVLAHGRCRRLGVVGHGGEIDHLAMGVRRRFQKPAERADVPDDRLGGDLFLEIVARVGGQVFRRRIGEEDRRKEAVLQRPVQIEPLPKLDANERMQGARPRPTAEEVDALPAQAPGARSGEKEPDPVPFDHEVHLVEELGHLLDLVDDEDGRVVRQRFADQGGITGQADEQGLIEQTVGGAAVELLADQRGLAGLARAEQKTGAMLHDAPRAQISGDDRMRLHHDNPRIYRRLA